ncbi:AGAP008701-PA, partial [Anopheles gambiae str. PEST]
PRQPPAAPARTGLHRPPPPPGCRAAPPARPLAPAGGSFPSSSRRLPTHAAPAPGRTKMRPPEDLPACPPVPLHSRQTCADRPVPMLRGRSSPSLAVCARTHRDRSPTRAQTGPPSGRSPSHLPHRLTRLPPAAPCDTSGWRRTVSLPARTHPAAWIPSPGDGAISSPPPSRLASTIGPPPLRSIWSAVSTSP